MNRRSFLRTAGGALACALFIPAERLAFGVPKQQFVVPSVKVIGGEALLGPLVTDYQEQWHRGIGLDYPDGWNYFRARLMGNTAPGSGPMLQGRVHMLDRDGNEVFSRVVGAERWESPPSPSLSSTNYVPEDVQRLTEAFDAAFFANPDSDAPPLTRASLRRLMDELQIGLYWQGREVIDVTKTTRGDGGGCAV